jgi:hypothetical protein
MLRAKLKKRMKMTVCTAFLVCGRTFIAIAFSAFAVFTVCQSGVNEKERTIERLNVHT